ncbi:MAG: NAD(P)/FAD-dependent oxidoreductase, partial [Brasilonema sp.]
MSVKPLRVIVVGGGAAGFFGAICAARSTEGIAAAEANPNAQVTILEASHQVLAKVRISGGGRCNVTQACFDPSGLVQNYPRGGKALLGAFTRFQAKDTVAWFAAHGVPLKTEADGRMFPITDSSETIVNCLINTAKAAGVHIRTETLIVAVKPLSTHFEISLKSGEMLECNCLLLATGSNPVGYR